MDNLILFLSIVVILNSCNGNKITSEKNTRTYGIDSLFDYQGRLIEVFGNEGTRDNDMNFREYYKYDNRSLLMSKKTYIFDAENIECKVLDSLDCLEDKFYYNSENELVEVHTYLPEYEDNERLENTKISCCKKIVHFMYLCDLNLKRTILWHMLN